MLKSLKRLMPKNSTHAACHLAGTVDKFTLVDKDCGLITSYQIYGCASSVGDTDFTEIIDEMQGLAGNLSKSGHEILISYINDPARTVDQLNELHAPMLGTQKKYGIKTETLAKAQSSTLLNNATFEVVYVSVKTKLDILNNQADEKEQKKSTVIVGDTGITLSKLTKTFEALHSSFCESVFEKIFSHKIIFKKLTARKALSFLKYEIDFDDSSKDYPFKLYGDKLPKLKKRKHKNDIGNLFHQAIDQQLHTQSISLYEKDQTMLKVNQKYIAPLIADEISDDAEAFDVFLNNLSRRVPVRFNVRLKLGSDEILSNLAGIKLLFSRILSVFHSNNRGYSATVDQFKKLAQHENLKFIQVNYAVATWANSYKEAIANRSAIIEAMKSWGELKVIMDKGNAYEAFAETLPFFYFNEPVSTGFFYPLSEALLTLPIFRPANIWESGQVIFKTLDGKIFPYKLMSELHDYWNFLVFGQPGSGKSVFVLFLLLMAETYANTAALPYLTVIDINQTSKSLADLLTFLMPKKMKHEVEYIRLQNNSSKKANIFDTPLGFRTPTGIDKVFLENFLSLLVTGSSRDIKELPDFISQLVREAYERFSDNSEHAKLYEKRVDPEVDKFVDKHYPNISDKDFRLTWWMLVDKLAEHGNIGLAEFVQRLAVPDLRDLSATITQSTDLNARYGELTYDSESYIKFISRRISSVTQRFPMLLGPSTYSIKDAKVLIFNLQDVIHNENTPAAYFHNAVMYMFARHLGVSRFYRNEESFSEEPISDFYKEYHRKKNKEMETSIKFSFSDELHKFNNPDDESSRSFVTSQIGYDFRTGRKFDICTGVASQRSADFDLTMRELSSSVFILNNPVNPAERDNLQKTYEYSDDVRKIMEVETKKPGHLLMVSDTKVGKITQILKLEISTYILWALTSVNIDNKLRNELAKNIGYGQAINILTEVWPMATAKKDVESMDVTSNLSDENDTMIIDRLIGKALQHFKNRGNHYDD